MKKFLFVLTFCTPLFLKAQPIQNGNMENWTVAKFDVPNNWLTSNESTVTPFGVANVTKVSPGVTNSAIRLETMAFGPDVIPGILSNSNDPMLGVGGVAFSQKPTGLSGHFRYNIAANDTARIFIGYKNAGTMYATDIVSIWGAQSTFTLHNYPLQNAVASSLTPDTIVMAIISGDFLGTFVAGSWLEIDNLHFTGSGVTQSINGEFDSWTADSLISLDDWGPFGVVLSTPDAFQGTNAAKLISVDNGAGLEPSSIEQIFTPAQTIDTLVGYYKYTTKGNDFARAQVVLSKTASAPVSFNLQLPPVNTYTRFQIPIVTDANTVSGRVTFQSSWDMSSIADSSALYIDSVFIKKQSVGISGIEKKAAIKVFPNPANDLLSIAVEENSLSDIQLLIYNPAGVKIFATSTKLQEGVATVPVKSLAAGVYIYEVCAGGRVYKGQFLKN